MRYTRLVLLTLALATCGNLSHLTVDQGATAMIPGASLLEQLVPDLGFSGFGDFDISQSQEFKNQGVTKQQINSVKLKTLTLEVTQPPNGQDLTFLESLSFFVESAGLPKKEIARGGPFAKDAKKVSLTLMDVELAPYASAARMTFSSAVKGRRPSSNTTLDAKVSLDVDVNVAGALCGGK
jgi:hypothetical protein